MNELNVERLNALGLQAGIQRTRAGEPVVTIRLPSGEILAHGLADTHRTEQFMDGHAQKPARERMFVESDPNDQAAAAALLAVGHAAARVNAVQQDPRLSTDGRREAVTEAVSGTLTAVAGQYARTRTEAERLAAERATLYAVPQPDVTAAVIDGELRRDFASRSIDEQAQLLRELHRPEYRALALALSRSPLPLGPNTADAVSKAWEQHVERAEPAKTGTLKKAIATNQAATGLLKGLTDALTRGFAKDARPLDRMTVYKALKSIEGAWPVEFPAGERGMLDFQIAKAAREAEEARHVA